MLLGKKYASAILAAFTALAATAVAQASPVLIGSFEGNQSDGWGWFNIPNNYSIDPFATNPNVTYSYVTTGATNGTTALSVDGAGFQGFDLAYDLMGNGHLQDFMNNDILSFDMTFPISDTSSGYAQVYNIVLNSNTGGFTQVGDAPFANQYPPYSGQTTHVTLNYDSYKQAMGTGPVNYLQLFLTTNNGGGAPSAMYLDNFTLSPVNYPGDADGSGFVDATDFGILVGHYLTSTANGPNDADFDNSGFVDSTDFGILVGNYLTGPNPPPSAVLSGEPSLELAASAVPEPSSLGILAIGGTALARRRRGQENCRG